MSSVRVGFWGVFTKQLFHSLFGYEMFIANSVPHASLAICRFIFTADRLAQLVEHRITVREVTGLNLGQTNNQGH